MVAISEAELVQRVTDGDQAAFQRLVHVHLGPVSHYIARMTGDTTLAEDLSQDVFLRLWSHASQYDPDKAKLTTWLHNIARNLCIDHFRRQGRIVSDEATINGAASTDDVLVAASGHDVMKALQHLPEAQRSAIVLCYYQGFSNREAAELLDLNVPALESLLARGRRKLKTLLAEVKS